MSETSEAESQTQIKISRSQLPISCPTAETNPAALHPRVFIPLKKSGDQGVCPYCGAVYLLID